MKARFGLFPADDLARPFARRRELDPRVGADDLLIRVDGVGVARPARPSAMGDLRRGLALQARTQRRRPIGKERTLEGKSR